MFMLVAMKESWVEIYKVPKDTWVKEMEAALTAVTPSRKPTMESSVLVSLTCQSIILYSRTLLSENRVLSENFLRGQNSY